MVVEVSGLDDCVVEHLAEDVGDGGGGAFVFDEAGDGLADVDREALFDLLQLVGAESVVLPLVETVVQLGVQEVQLVGGQPFQLLRPEGRVQDRLQHVLQEQFLHREVQVLNEVQVEQHQPTVAFGLHLSVFQALHETKQLLRLSLLHVAQLLARQREVAQNV